MVEFLFWQEYNRSTIYTVLGKQENEVVMMEITREIVEYIRRNNRKLFWK